MLPKRLAYVESNFDISIVTGVKPAASGNEFELETCWFTLLFSTDLTLEVELIDTFDFEAFGAFGTLAGFLGVAAAVAILTTVTSVSASIASLCAFL
ncbi:unnamed protein product [[Candida] boidinii]|nr:unnamed protein product [[Candida] boidinii]